MFENILLTLNTKRPVIGEQIYEHFLYDMMTGTINGHVGEINGKLVIPDDINGVEIRTIGAGAFAGCDKITGVEIGNGITEIEQGAFSGCISVKELKLPKNLKYIGMGAFMGCKEIRIIDIPDGTAHIAERAFSGCGRGHISLPNSIEYVAENAFEKE